MYSFFEDVKTGFKICADFANNKIELINNNVFLMACKTDFLSEAKRWLPQTLEVTKQGVVIAFDNNSSKVLAWLLEKFDNKFDIYTLCVERVLLDWSLNQFITSLQSCAKYLNLYQLIAVQDAVQRLIDVYSNNNALIFLMDFYNKSTSGRNEIIKSFEPLLLGRLEKAYPIPTNYFENVRKLSAFILFARPGNLPKELCQMVSLIFCELSLNKMDALPKTEEKLNTAPTR